MGHVFLVTTGIGVNVSFLAGFILGAILGVACVWSAAWTAAKSAILQHETAFDEERAHRSAMQALREEAIRRSQDIEHAPLNGWMLLREASHPTKILPMRK